MTLGELLVSACVATLAAGAAMAAVSPLQRGFAAQPEAAGVTQRTRVVAGLLSADLRRAALVLPYRAGDQDNDFERGISFRPDAITVLVDSAASLARGLLVPTEMRTYHLKRDSEGIWQLMQYDGRESDQPAVEDVVSLRFEYYGEARPPVAAVSDTGDVRVTYGASPPPLNIDDPADSWGAGENCTIANVDGVYVPRLATLADVGLVLLGPALLGDGPWCPDASHSFRFDADLLRIRRVRVDIRVQAARPFRGLASATFLNSGLAGDPAWYVPDETLTLEIGPRNVHAR